MSPIKPDFTEMDEMKKGRHTDSRDFEGDKFIGKVPMTTPAIEFEEEEIEIKRPEENLDDTFKEKLAMDFPSVLDEKDEFHPPQVTGISWDPQKYEVTVNLSSGEEISSFKKTCTEGEYKEFEALFNQDGDDDPDDWQYRVNDYFYETFSVGMFEKETETLDEQ